MASGTDSEKPSCGHWSAPHLAAVDIHARVPQCRPTATPEPSWHDWAAPATLLSLSNAARFVSDSLRGCRESQKRLDASQDPPEYYDPPGGFLSFDIRVGQQVEGGGHLLLMDIGKPIKMEDYDIDFSLVHAQLAQVGENSNFQSD
jgi:hypothetical protein